MSNPAAGTPANEFEYFEQEIHAIMSGADIVRRDTFTPDAAMTRSWYFLELGEIAPTEESEGGGSTSWTCDFVALLGIVASTASGTANSMRAISNALLADLIARFEAARFEERTFTAADDTYDVRVQDLRLTTQTSAFADSPATGWAIARGRVHYDRSQHYWST